jgi:hypothetical protein
MTTNKIPFPLLVLEVEKLYEKPIPDNEEAIVKHCEFIADFIRSCGYSEDEYFERLMQDEEDKEKQLS